ncbi:MAG: tetraacyldisaccharide 4'-kinase [Terracidiphilus sp.]|jgi:tetraacyldisaccharide 4'-kinase
MSPVRLRRLLLPLIPLYRLALAVREFGLRNGLEPVRRLSFPVVSIGNLSTGGSGKTPLTIALAKALIARGLRVDVLTRGYGRRSQLPTRVNPEGSAEEFGDEPLLIAREAGVPVFVAARRYDAGLLAEAGQAITEEATGLVGQGFSPGTEPAESTRALLIPAKEISCTVPTGLRSSHVESAFPTLKRGANEHCASGAAARTFHMQRSIAPEVCLHLLDDGFQHRQLARDVEILLLDSRDWQDGLLPAGNLREPLKAIRRASIIAIPADETDLEAELRAWGWQGPVWRLSRKMEVPAADGPVAAFCGIARPKQFFAGLEAAGLRLAYRTAFPDHFAYTRASLEELLAKARAAGAAALVTTEKDLVRMGKLAAAFPKSMPLLAAKLRIEIEDQDAALDWLIDRLSTARESQ